MKCNIFILHILYLSCNRCFCLLLCAVVLFLFPAIGALVMALETGSFGCLRWFLAANARPPKIERRHKLLQLPQIIFAIEKSPWFNPDHFDYCPGGEQVMEIRRACTEPIYVSLLLESFVFMIWSIQYNFIQGGFLTGPPLKMSSDWPPPPNLLGRAPP